MLSRWVWFFLWGCSGFFPTSCTLGSVITGEIWQSCPKCFSCTWALHRGAIHHYQAKHVYFLLPCWRDHSYDGHFFFLLQIHWRVYRKVPSCLLFQQDKASSMTLIKPHLFPFKEGFTTLSPCICRYSPLSGQCRQSAQELEVAGVLKGRTASPLDIWWKEEIYKTGPLSMPCINVSVGIIFIFFLYALFFYKASSFTSKKD